LTGEEPICCLAKCRRTRDSARVAAAGRLPRCSGQRREGMLARQSPAGTVTDAIVSARRAPAVSAVPRRWQQGRRPPACRQRAAPLPASFRPVTRPGPRLPHPETTTWTAPPGAPGRLCPPRRHTTRSPARRHHQRTAFPARPRPENRTRRAGTRGCTPGSAAHVKPETHRRGGPSVAVRGNADGAHRPSWRPGRRPLCVRGHRNTSTHSDTR
jgi:hypothetical protein